MVQKTDNLSSQFPDIEGTVAQCSLPNAISFTLNLASTALRIRVALPLNEQIETTSNNPAANIHRYPPEPPPRRHPRRPCDYRGYRRGLGDAV